MDNNQDYEASDELLYKNLEEPIEVERTDVGYTTKEIEPKTKCGVISLILLAISLIGPEVVGYVLSQINLIYWENIVETIFGVVAISSFVLMIYTRIRYPKDRAGKAAMWLFIAGFIFIALSIIFFIVACSACAAELRGY